MLSDMMVTVLLLPFPFLLSQLSASFGYGDALVGEAVIVPSISIGTCSPLMNGKSFSICCKASFLDDALVRLYGPNIMPYDLPINYVPNNNLSLTCSNEDTGNITISCSSTEFETLYLVNFSSFDPAHHLGGWSCETYIGSAKMTVTSREVITRNDGLVEIQVNQTVQLLWDVTWNYMITSPSNEVLVNVSNGILRNKSDKVEFVTNRTKAGIKLNSTSGSDAGMYVQISNGVRAAISLLVQEKPTQPKVIYRYLHIEGNPTVASAILYCFSESRSKGPMMYEQRVVYKWRGVTSQIGLQIQVYGSGVQVGNVNCTKVSSYPISCHAEQYGLKSETTWIIPQSLCSMSQSDGNDYSYLTTPAPSVGVVLAVTIPIVVFTLTTIAVFFCCIPRMCNRGGDICECSCSRDCGDICEDICECSCLRHCCQAIRNRFVAGFQAVRGCFNSTVTFLQYCHLRRRERNPSEDNNPPLPDTDFDSVAEQIDDQGDGNQPAEYNANHDTNHQLADGIEEGAIGGAAASTSRTEAEMRVQYQIEARSNLNSLHSMLKHPPQMLRVQRNQIVTDVLSLFEDSSTGTHLISTRFIDEDGVDGGGVTRDMLTVFWNEAKERYFHGNEAFVPHLRPERLSEKKDFITLGQIFSHSTATLSSIPIQMCRSTLMVIIYDECEINPDTLLEDFLLFLDSDDRELLKSSLSSFDNMGQENRDKLQEFFMKFGMGIVLRAATLRQHVINLAQNELCIKPKFFCENMRKGIPRKHMKHFWMHMTLEHFDHLYEDFLINAENIWPKIRCETWPLQNPDERRAYGYLRDLIQDLPEETLLSFVQFVTADRKIPSAFITVGFNDTQGIARCPIASTCAYRLDIPVSYSSFAEFKEEFMMVLNSDEAKTFNRN